MYTKIRKAKALEPYTVQSIKEELYAVEYELDQPVWMCSREYLNRMYLKKRKLLARLKAIDI